MDSSVQEIKDKLDIVDVISGYIQVKRAGVNYRANCPFHNEKTPSFNISQSRQIWHCFGCGLGGDMFTFVEKIENSDFRDALKILADKAGVQLKTGVFDKNAALKATIIKINNFVAEVYKKSLYTTIGKTALDYLKKRELTDETIEKWKIGFAPDSFNTIENILVKKKIPLLDGLAAGVLGKNDRGNVYDRFRNRVTFPIYDTNGEVVGFTARTLDPNEKAGKYINSPETVVYNKSRIIFGLNFAKNEIRKKDYAIVVEGQMDCIKCHQAGFSNAVATSGTAFTESQLITLKRYSKNILLIFDSDTAGSNASDRVADIAMSIGLSVKVVRLQDGKDPDEVITKDPQLFAKALKSSVWFIDDLVNRAHQFKPSSVEQNKFVSSQIIPRIVKLEDPLEQDHFVKEVHKEFGISEAAIKKGLRGDSKDVIKQVPVSTNTVEVADPNTSLERLLLAGLIKYPDLRDAIIPQIDTLDFSDPEVKAVIPKISLESTKEGLAALTEITVVKVALFMLESYLTEWQQNEEVAVRELEKSFSTLRLNGIKRQLSELSLELKAAERTKNSADLERLRNRLALLLKTRTELERNNF